MPRRLGILARCACSTHVGDDDDDDDADADDYDDDDDDDDDGDGDDCVSTRDAGVNVGAWIDVHAKAIREDLVVGIGKMPSPSWGAGNSVEHLLFVPLCNTFARAGWTAQLARSWFAAIFFSV